MHFIQSFLSSSACACIGLALCALLSSPVLAHDHRDQESEVPIDPDMLLDEWIFRPDYALPANASNIIHANSTRTISRHQELERESLPVLFHGRNPTERIRGILPIEKLPKQSFTLETWLNDHVDQPVGFALIASGPDHQGEAGWTLAYHSTSDDKASASFHVNCVGAAEPHIAKFRQNEETGFLEYWWHLVAVFDRTTVQLYVNGELKDEVPIESSSVDYGTHPTFEIAAYLDKEPEMQLANLLHSARIYQSALSQRQIHTRFRQLCEIVEKGIVIADNFHFPAGPYLNYATQHSMNVVWETDRPTKARVLWGKNAHLEQSAELKNLDTLHEFQIGGLEPHTPYFYRIEARDSSGQSIDSGLLTFQTAVGDGEPFKFAVIGDTETRPHINNQVAQKIWAERPNFVVNLGDLTDGGMRDRKFQWNLEYFTGINSLGSRVPFFPVPGNGEADLYWYKKYHMLPGEESPYSFRYGNAEFFMLDSNLKQKEFAAEGRQYEWLEDKLISSNALWKFVCFHHAPYTSEEDDYGNAWIDTSTLGDLETRQLVPLFEKHHVDMVMFGHLHSYERTLPISQGRVEEKGVVYLLAGGGGGNLEDFAPNPAFFSEKTFRGHHYCIIRINGNRLRLTMQDTLGDIRDQMTLRKHLQSGGLAKKAVSVE